MKTLTIDGKRYRLETCPRHNRVLVKGPGLLIGLYLPEGVGVEAPNLREHAAEAVNADRQRRLDARQALRRAR